MSHPFGDRVTQHLHRKHGLSQAKLAEGILQDPSIIGKMCKGERLNGPQARERVCAIIDWLRQQTVLTTVDEANGLLIAAGMATLRATDASEAQLLHQLHTPAPAPPLLTSPRLPVTTTPRTNLPISLTSFIGRVEAITEVAQLVATHRLVTLTGAGGVGKTRLALEVGKAILDFKFEILDSLSPRPAHLKSQIQNLKFADGIWFVDLSPLTDPEAIPQRILDLWRVPEQAEFTPLATLTTYLSTKQALLILDNCEHLIDACAALAETLLQQCPQLALLATSREALNIGGETPWRVPSLTRPRAGAGWEGQSSMQPQFTPEALARFEAVTLFVERAAVRQPGFALTAANAPAVAQICSRLDGIPLALEMAAARVTIFTVEDLARRLDGAFDGRFQLLTNGARTAPLRHQTLRATLEWSYTLLPLVEQRLLARLSVFSGGWTLAAAEKVAGATLERLSQLVNKSLVIADQQDGRTRYRLLETVRQFAAEQMAINEQEQQQIQQQHSGYYLRLLSEQEVQLQSTHQQKALDVIRSDFANISAAWHWAVEQHEFAELDPVLHALFLYGDVRGKVCEGFTLFTAAAANVGKFLTATPTNQNSLRPLWVRLVLRVGACEVMLGNYQRGEQAIQAALPLIIRERERIFALEYLGFAAAHQGELPLARARLHESLAISQHCNDWAGMASALHRLILGNSDYPEVCRLCVESLALWRKVGRPDRIAGVTVDLGWYTWCVGDYAIASVYVQEGLALCEEVGLVTDKAWALNTLGYLAWSRGELAVAERLHQEAMSIYATLGLQFGVGTCMADLSLALADAGRVTEAVPLAQEAVVIMRALNNQMMLTVSLSWLGAVHLAAGDFVAAHDALVEVIQRAWKQGYLAHLMNAFYYVAEWLVLASPFHNHISTLDDQALAVTIVSFIRTQVATWQFFKDKATQLQAKIGEALPADLCATAIARGRASTVEALVATLLAAMR